MIVQSNKEPVLIGNLIVVFFQNDLEKTLLSKLSSIQSSLSPRPQGKLSVVSMEDELSMMHELTQVNSNKIFTVKHQYLLQTINGLQEALCALLDNFIKIVHGSFPGKYSEMPTHYGSVG